MHDAVTARNPMENLGLPATTALVLGAIFITTGIFGIGGALPRVVEGFADHANAAFLIQIAGAIAAPAFAIASPAAGKVVARLGERTVYVGSAWLVIVAGAAGGLCTAPWQLIALRILVGIGVAGVITAAKGGIGQTGEKKRHLLFSLVSFLGSVSAVAIFPLVGALTAISWRHAFLANLLLIPIALLAMTLPRHAPHAAAAPGQGKASGPVAGVPLPVIFAAMASGWAMVSVPLHAPFYLKSTGITDPVRIGSILGFASLFALAGTLGYGLFQRFIGTRRTIVLALLVVVGGGLLSALSGLWVAEMAGICLISLGGGIFAAGIYAFAIESAQGRAPISEIAGVVSLSTYGPQILFPLAAGALSAVLGAASPYGMVAVLVLLATAGLVLSGRRT